MTVTFSIDEQNQAVEWCMALLTYLRLTPPEVPRWDETDELMSVALTLRKFGYEAERVAYRLTSISGATYILDAIKVNNVLIFDAQGRRGAEAICRDVHEEHQISRQIMHVQRANEWFNDYTPEEKLAIGRTLTEAYSFLQAHSLKQNTQTAFAEASTACRL